MDTRRTSVSGSRWLPSTDVQTVSHRTVVGLCAFALCVLAIHASRAADARTGPIPERTISKPSPLRACPDGQSRVFVDSEVEPSIAFDPSRRRAVVVYQQDRFPDGAARGIAAVSSTDGGRIWRRTILPVGFCAGSSDPEPFRTSDPWVSIGPDGRVYALASNVAVVSRDGGRTWTNPVALDRPSSSVLLDKGSLTADPVRAGVAYAVWARFRRPASGAPVESDAMLSRTKDGGRTWSAAKVILEHGRGAGSISSVMLADPRRGRLYHFAFWQVGPQPGLDHLSSLVCQWSVNDGASWTSARRIARVRTVAGRARDPSTGRQIRTGFAVPSFAVDRSSGALYAVWQDSRFAADRVDQILLSSSRDGGRTWTSPVRVSRAVSQAFVPTVAVSSRGTIGVAYYEAPKRRVSTPTPIQYWLAISHDGGRTFSRRAIGSPFSLRFAPLIDSVPELAVPPGLFLGDYMGLDASDGRFHVAFVTANTTASNRTDVRYAVVAGERAR
jgi:hypothetical protein